jgi:sorbitol-specific phosphotransferase system component IIBC
VVSIDMKGTVRVGCLEHAKIRTVAEVGSGSFGLLVQLVGDRVVVAGGGASSIRWATFANRCH